MSHHFKTMFCHSPPPLYSAEKRLLSNSLHYQPPHNSYFVLCRKLRGHNSSVMTFWLTVTTREASKFKTGTERINVNMKKFDSLCITTERS